LKTKKEIMNVKVEICFPVTAKCFWAFLLSAFQISAFPVFISIFCFLDFCFFS